MDEDGEDEGNVEEDKGNVEEDMAEEDITRNTTRAFTVRIT